MQKIYKKIALEPYKSRVPLVYPSIKDGKINYVTHGSIFQDNNANYNSIPLSVSEDICGSYSDFTELMGAWHEGELLPYTTIQEWYDEFNEYYDLLHSRSCKRVYTSAVEYYRDLEDKTGLSEMAYEDIDDNFNGHGGNQFYKWLNDYYFLLIDLRYEYNEAVKFYNNSPFKFNRTYTEFLECIENLDCQKYYYPDALELYSNVCLLYEKFGDKETYNNEDDCCDYEYYKSIGGYDLYLVLRQWIEKADAKLEDINYRVKAHESKLSPSLSISLNLQSKVEDFGDYSSLSTDFVAGKEYSVGNICTYEENVYILTGNTGGYKLDDESHQPVFDSDQWQLYSEYYIKEHPNERNRYSVDYVVSGRTVSSLGNFQRNNSYDLMGNELPGYFATTRARIFPNEGLVLDLPYETCKYINEIKYTLDDDSVIYKGDLLYCFDVYLKDNNGDKILGTELRVNQDETFSDYIGDLNEAIDNFSDAYDGNIYIDFTYYKGCYFTIDKSGTITVKQDELTDQFTGIKYVDSCKLTLMNCSYYISSNKFIPLKYYDITYDTESIYSESLDRYINVDMTTWFLYPAAFTSNSDVMSPGFRKEELLGFTSPEEVKTPDNGIYINRGYTTALDKHLRLGEISSIETLESYGNGLFSMLNKETESSL
jgi:hypothetical protein